MLARSDDNVAEFTLEIDIVPGVHQFLFFVDGEERTNPEYPSAYDPSQGQATNTGT